MSARFFRMGRFLGEFFTDRYFQLPEEGQRRWDAARIMHHGALGYILAAGSAKALAKEECGPLRRAVYGAALSAGLGITATDLHDRDRWWCEGRLFEARRERGAADEPDASLIEDAPHGASRA